MVIWSVEVKELEKLHNSFKGQYPKLDKELAKLVKTDDENMILVYARRCLEVMITDLCELELGRPRGTEPLKGIIDKLYKEEKVPHNIIASMQNVNNLSTFGAHPKDFDPMQVKPVLLDLTTTLKWYIKLINEENFEESKTNIPGEIQIEHANEQKRDIKSLVILPFDNFTGDKNLDYVASGMHASLIGDIGRLGALRVIGKTSSNAFINTNKSAQDIAKELSIDALVEPTLTNYDDTVCIQIRVITPFPEEKQIWVGDYKEEKSKILNIYNRITKQIADELMVRISPEEELLLSKSRIVDKEAYDTYLKGYYYLDDFGKESLVTARTYLQEAIEKDASWAPLYIGMGGVWLTMANMGFESIELAISETYKNLLKAKDLNPDLPDVHFMLAALATSAEWDWAKGEKEFLRTLAINPNHALARMQYSLLLFALQRPGEGMAQAQLGYELDPLNPMIQTLYGTALACKGDCESALLALVKVINSDPNHYMANNVIVGASYMCGDFNRMFETDKKILPFDSVTIAEIDRIYNDKGFVEAYNEINRQLEIFAEDNPVVPVDMAWRYYIINKDDKAMEWIEKAFEQHDGNLMLITTRYVNFWRLYGNQGFIDIVKKLNLPVPAG